MRRVLLAAFALCLVGAVSAPVTATPGARADVFQIAWADWIDMNGRTGTFYGAIGVRGAGSVFGARSEGIVFKGSCIRRRHGDMVSISCRGTGESKTVGPDEFWVDPMLESASLDMTVDGSDHSVDWTGRRGDEHGAAHSNGNRTVAFNERWRNAQISGNVYGRTFPRGRSFWKLGFLYEIAQLNVRHDLERLGIHVRDDGSLRIERTFRVPG